jgi:hypothetical protein
MTVDEHKEFLGKQATRWSVNLQFQYLTKKWIKESDLSALLLLQVLIGGILKEEECEHLYNKVQEIL